jgi:hypothetical protein
MRLEQLQKWRGQTLEIRFYILKYVRFATEQQGIDKKELIN